MFLPDICVPAYVSRAFRHTRLDSIFMHAPNICAVNYLFCPVYELLTRIAFMNSPSIPFQISYQKVVFILSSDQEIQEWCSNPLTNWALSTGQSLLRDVVPAVSFLDPHQAKRPASSEDAWQEDAWHPGSPAEEGYRSCNIDWMISEEWAWQKWNQNFFFKIKKMRSQNRVVKVTMVLQLLQLSLVHFCETLLMSFL